MAWTQTARQIAIASPLGDDVLLIQGFKLRDEIGRPFVCEVNLYSQDPEIDFDKIVGENVTIRLERGDGKSRYINGHVARFMQGGTDGGGTLHRYNATIVPWLWFLTRTSDCRIFQEKSVPDIIMEILSDAGFSELVDKQLTGTYETREYVVQYRETSFNFISRLMEQEGIYYFFKHEDGKHKLVLADAPSAHVVEEGYEELPLQSESNVGHQGVTEWVLEKRIVPGKHTLRDFDPLVPGKDLHCEEAIAREHAWSDAEIFDYPGLYKEKAQGDIVAAVRFEELSLPHEVGRAKTDARAMTVGAKFKLTGSARTDQDGEYVIVSMNCEANEDIYATESTSEELFGGGFTAVKATTQIRAARTTPKPVINGPQTAIVVGASGEEIETDEHGRVKVHFHWDRWGAADEKASCWIRVSQQWAGKKWGFMFIPRIGQEVIVEFLEGDPDRPIITGRVYNGENGPPYALPDNKHISTIKSSSTKGGEGFNEIRFDDNAGEEQLFIHAQKNLDVRVQEDRFETIGNDWHLIVQHDQHEHVLNDRTETVDRDHKELIKRDRNLGVEGKEAKAVTGSLSLTVEDDVAEVFKKNASREVTKDYYLKADNIVIEAGTNLTIKVGDDSYIVIEASGISLKTKEHKMECATGEWKSEGSLKMEATGTADLKSTGALTVESSAAATVKGTASLTCEASGAATFKGATTSVG